MDGTCRAGIKVFEGLAAARFQFWISPVPLEGSGDAQAGREL